MGARQSSPQPVVSVVREEPYPAVSGADGLSLSQAEKCNACRLDVDTKITTSNVKLKRERGMFTPTQCKLYEEDLGRVNNRYLSVGDFLAKLQTGAYSTPVAEKPGEQFCQELTVTPEDAEAMRQSEKLDTAKFKRGRIRKVSGASFSEETKAKFIPSIPFNMSFEARKAAMGPRGTTVFQPVNETFTVTQMTVYHPSPIRIDSVQADAMLSLNDPTDRAAKYIVLIPLRAMNSGSPSNLFFSKIAKQLFTVKEPRPDTGEYEETTIPTGNDWALDKLFTLSGEGGASRVKNGFFTWTGVAGYERFNKGTVRDGNTNITTFGWRQTEGLTAPQYILLDTPLDINTEDMATLTQSLPVTPPREAIHPIPAQTNLVYHKSSEPPAPDTLSGKGVCGITNLCEGFTTGTVDESFLKTCPGAKCDPFLQNAARSAEDNSIFTPERMFALYFNLMIAIAMFLGAYLALNLVKDDYDYTVRNFSEQLGQAIAIWAKGISDKVGKLRSAVSTGTSLLQGKQGGLEGLASSFKDTGGLDKLASSFKDTGGLDKLASSLKGKEGDLKSLASSIGDALKK